MIKNCTRKVTVILYLFTKRSRVEPLGNRVGAMVGAFLILAWSSNEAINNWQQLVR